MKEQHTSKPPPPPKCRDGKGEPISDEVSTSIDRATLLKQKKYINSVFIHNCISIICILI